MEKSTSQIHYSAVSISCIHDVRRTACSASSERDISRLLVDLEWPHKGHSLSQSHGALLPDMGLWRLLLCFMVLSQCRAADEHWVMPELIETQVFEFSLPLRCVLSRLSCSSQRHKKAQPLPIALQHLLLGGMNMLKQW